MRTRGTPTRLELHRLKFHQNGRVGPRLSLQQLSDAEKELIQHDLLEDVRVKRIDFTGDLDEEVFDQVYLEVLCSWGVMCTHPSGSLQPSRHPLARTCSVCGSMVTDWAQKRDVKDLSSRPIKP
jgi:hypothetical protein